MHDVQGIYLQLMGVKSFCLQLFCWLQVDAMKLGVKDFKKEYKKINIDQVEVGFIILFYRFRYF